MSVGTHSNYDQDCNKFGLSLIIIVFLKVLFNALRTLPFPVADEFNKNDGFQSGVHVLDLVTQNQSFQNSYCIWKNAMSILFSNHFEKNSSLHNNCSFGGMFHQVKVSTNQGRLLVLN